MVFPPFDLEKDTDAYCYLKANLEPQYSVESAPEKIYYSEWIFRYTITKNGHFVHELEGDFREIEPGSLAAEAMALVESLKGDHDADW